MSQTREQPSRYTRSFGGLIGAMLVTLLFVGVYVGFRALGREQPDGAPHPVDYFTSVRSLQEADMPVVYPRDLPTGWVATSVAYDRGTHPQWTVGMITAAGDFVGVTQQDAPLEDLLHSFVDPSPDRRPDTAVDSIFGDTWQTWSDTGGDHALSTTVAGGPLAGERVLVYGSAPLATQEQLVQLLSTDDLPPRAGS